MILLNLQSYFVSLKRVSFTNSNAVNEYAEPPTSSLVELLKNTFLV